MWKRKQVSNIFRLNRVFCCGYVFLFQFLVALGTSLIDQAEQDFNRGSYDSAKTKYLTILDNNFLEPTQRAYFQCRLGVVQSILRDYAKSQQALERAFSSKLLNPKNGSLCFYALMQLYVMHYQYAKAKELSVGFGEPIFNSLYLSRIYALNSEIGAKTNDPKFETIYLQRLKKIMDDNGFKQVELKILDGRVVTLLEVRKRLGLDSNSDSKGARDTSLSLDTKSKEAQNSGLTNADPKKENFEVGSISQSVSSNLLADFWNGIKTQNADTYKPWFGDFSVGNIPEKPQEVETILNQSGVEVPGDQFLARLRALKTDNIRNLRIGVLLPESQNFLRYKHKILRSLASFSNSTASSEMVYRYFIKSFDSDPGSLETQVLEGLFVDKVHAFIALVSSSQLSALEPSIKTFGIPFIALGPVSVFAGESHEGVVRLGNLSESQSNSLIKELKTFGGKRVAVLAPADAFGKDQKDSFIDAAKQASVDVVRVQYYDPKNEIFNSDLESFVEGLEQTKLSDDQKEKLQEQKKRALAQKRKFDPREFETNTKLEVDGIFLPDTLKKSQTIAMTFAFLRVDGLRFLGERSWKESLTGTPSIADRHLEGARVPVLQKGSFSAYVDRDLESNASDSDMERQAFDAMIFLRQAHYLAKSNTPSLLVKAMKEPSFAAEGIAKYGPVRDSGEPVANFALKRFSGGNVNDNLTDFPRSELPETKKK